MPVNMAANVSKNYGLPLAETVGRMGYACIQNPAKVLLTCFIQLTPGYCSLTGPREAHPFCIIIKPLEKICPLKWCRNKNMFVLLQANGV